MQSGKIKHWNADKGYGFIDVDQQDEDVFFHISTVRLSQPIKEGQAVYFNSARNDKNQLRATEVTSTDFSLLAYPKPNGSTNSSKTTAQNTTAQNTPAGRNRSKNTTNKPNNGISKKSPLSTLFSIIAILAMAVYFFADLRSEFFVEDLSATTTSQTSNVAINQATANAITGDAQIDATIALIKQGGPFPYPDKDGTTFYNRENKLPAQSSGYYREYTVPTPEVLHRGARRIVTGGNPPTVYYLTLDHYDSFSKLEVN